MVQCPYCFKSFKIPGKRHYPKLPGQGGWHEHAGTCGQGERIAEPHETVNCGRCLIKMKKLGLKWPPPKPDPLDELAMNA